jgi:ATP-dependent helicase/nuclease subunit B
MPYNPTKLNKIVHALRAGAIIITPNNRLSEQLLTHYVKENNQTVIKKPSCLSYPSFLRQTFDDLHTNTPHITHPTLLTDAQLRMLWRKVLTPDSHENTDDNLLAAAHQAFVMCEDWMLEYPHPDFHITPQTQHFERFRAKLHQRLCELNAITGHHLASYLTTHLTQAPCTHMLWVYFDEYTPVQHALHTHLETLGIMQEHLELDDSAGLSTQCVADDKHDETTLMMRFIQTELDRGTQKIGVVVPNLQQDASYLTRRFKRQFHENSFTFSLGKPLTDYPLVTHALQWLTLNQVELSRHQAELLLSSPYLHGAQKEHLTRAQCIQTIPLLQERIIPYTYFEDALHNKAPELFNTLKNITPYPEGNATPRTWAQRFCKRLQQLGFPGETSLTSVQYQCFERFMTLFDDFIALNIITPMLNAKSAHQALLDLAKTCIFQPEKANTPITILGLLEASGYAFDAVWLLSATDQNLPTKTRLSAFIPIVLQRELDMPYANASREHRLAQKRIHRLQHTCRALVFSYPKLTDDIPSLPSPLIRNLPHMPEQLIEPINPKTTHALLQTEETYLLPFTELDKITGGSARLSDQAQCPFRAFAAHRLYATDIPEPEDGLNAGLRGQLIHAILEHLWRILGTQEALLAARETTLNQHIDNAIEQAFKPLRQHKPNAFPPLVQAVEHTRLKRLVHAALAWERAREPFEVEALEAEFFLTLGELECRVRLDRLDHLASGEKWLIDYKSRIPSPLPWHEPRPDAPQLLLYALLDNAIRGLLFVELKHGKTTVRGFAEDQKNTDGIKALKADEHWEDYQTQWRERLSTLADEFYLGHCPPKPIRNSTCQTCNFHGLCRVSDLNTI